MIRPLRYLLCYVLSLTLFPLSVIASTQTVRIEPVVAGFGQASEIKLSLPQWQKDARLSVRPGGPILLDEIAFEHNPRLLATLNETTYTVVDDTSLVAIQWTPHPKIIGRYATKGNITHLLANKNQLIVAIKDQGLHWLDVSDAAKIHEVGFLNPRGNISKISAYQDHIAIAVNQHDIQIYKIFGVGQHKIAAKQRQIIHLSQSISSLVLKKDHLFLVGEQSGLSIFDISGDKQPVLVGAFLTSVKPEALVVDGKHAYLAAASEGFIVLDISHPGHITWLGSHSKFGSITDTLIHADRAFVNNNGSRLASLNISNPALPITGSFYKPEKGIQSMMLHGTDINIITGNKIQRIDFSQDADIQISNDGINQGGSRRAFVEKGIAYVADWFSGLHIYDMRDPLRPQHIGNYHTPGSSKGVVVKDGIAYIGDDDHGLQIVDVHDPQSPRKISEVLENGLGLAYTLKLVDNRVYLADHRGGFYIIDVSDVAHPKIIGSFDTPGKSWAIAVRGNTVFVADDQSGLLIFDISDPSKPVQIGQFKTDGYAEDLVLRDNLAYVTFFDGGLYILDISNPTSPREISHLPIPGNARSITLSKDIAYIAGWESGLQVVDISNVRRPRRVGYLDTNGSTWGLDIDGDYAYLWDWWGGIKVVDIRQPHLPLLVGLYQGRSQIQALDKTDNYALAASGADGLQVYDITNPLNPIWMNGLAFDDFARTVQTDGKHAWITLDSKTPEKSELVSVDVSDPFNVKLTGKLTLNGGRVHSIKQGKDYLYLAHQPQGISVIDSRQPGKMRFLHSLDITANQLALYKNNLLASTKRGIAVYSLAKAGNPEKIAVTQPGTMFSQLAIQNDLLVAVEPGKALHFFQMALPSNRQAPLTPLRTVHFSASVTDIQINGLQIYIYSPVLGMTILQTDDEYNIVSHTVYPPSNNHRQMLLHNGAVLFSGENTISSILPLPTLPPLTTISSPTGGQTAKLPAKLPMGSYHLELRQANGDTYLYPNALRVELKKSKKPHLTQEDFKKLLKQHLNRQSPAQQAHPTNP